MAARKTFDFWIFMTVLMLLSIGTIMVFSSSVPTSINIMHGDAYYFLKKQLVSVICGVIAMLVTMNIDYKKIGKWSPVLLVVSLVLLILVLIPGIGINRNGAQRWINLGTEFQPSEIAKIAVILFFSYSLSKRKDQLQSFYKGLLPYLILIGIIAALMLKEPHLSGTLVIAAVACIILFCAGAKISHFIMLAIPVVPGLIAVMTMAAYRSDRLKAWLNPMQYKKDEAWQVVQSLYAIGSGGLFGRGLGKSLQKFLYIPEPYNDYIFSILAEELGFIGVVAVLILFLIFIWRGIKVSMNAPDTFGSLAAIGITALIAVQTILNIAVVTNLVPSTGIALPFFSYGGTSLTFLMSGVGILLNISRYANYERI